MLDLQELQGLVRLHAKAQGVRTRTTESVLSAVQRSEGLGPGAWAYEWCRAGDLAVYQGKTLEAVHLYNLGRFPFVDCLGRAMALERCVFTFQQWKKKQGNVVQLDIEHEGHRVSSYASNLGRDRDALILVIGGIVSPKEQWAAFLDMAPRMQCSVVVVDFPGVGTNPLQLHASSSEWIGAVLDALRPFAQVDHTYAVGLSFGGHLLLQRALEDHRIRGITTIGAPIARFFQDPDWWQRVPTTTKLTLEHVTRLKAEPLWNMLNTLALSTNDLKRLRVPVTYIASLRDEIIPPDDWHAVASCVPHATLQAYDDVHGAPGHIDLIRKDIPLSILSQMDRTASWAVGWLKIARGIEWLRCRLAHGVVSVDDRSYA